MSAGPIYPSSAFPVDTGAGGRTFPNFYVGTNQGGTANAAPQDEGLGVAASIATDDKAIWSLRFPIPPTIPSGTLKLRALMLANATTGIAIIAVSDKNVAAGGIPSGVTLTTEAFATTNVSAVSLATTNTTVTTSTNHGLAVGNVVTIANIVGSVSANGTFTVTSVGSATTFNITTTTTAAYVSGGTVTEQFGAGWLTGSNDKYLECKIPLTSTPAGNDELVVALIMLHTNWTLAAVLTIIASILWE